jgi:CBS domain-containing protein
MVAKNEGKLAVRASNIMTTGVIAVGPNTPVQDIVMTLLSNRISAVPVLDEHGAPIGMVSEADVIHCAEIETERPHLLLHNLLPGKSAAEIMTKPVIAANPEMSLDELLSLFDKHRIKRVPVVDHGKIVGIISRSNILQALALSHEEFAHEAIAARAI